MKVKKHMDSFESVAKFGTVLQFLVLAALLAVAAADSAYPAYHQASYSAPSYSAKSYDYVSWQMLFHTGSWLVPTSQLFDEC